MRPDLLNPLFEPVSALAGIGPKLQKLFDRLVVPAEARRGAVIADILFHLPISVIDRRRQALIMRAPDQAVVTIRGIVDRYRFAANAKMPSRVFLADESGEIALVYFHARREMLEKTLPIGADRYVSGRIEWFNGAPQMVHPDHIVAPEEFGALPLIEPVYATTEGLTQRHIRLSVAGGLLKFPRLPEWLDEAVKSRQQLPDFKTALQALHQPEDPADLEAPSAVRRRLAYDELLANQLALALVRAQLGRRAGRGRAPTGKITALLRAALPFTLTGAQTRTIAEIQADLMSSNRMVRMVQGDVGAGKTMVALFAAASVIEAGGQAALMAPTELLARQHAASLRHLADAAGIRMAVLTGRDKGKAREQIISDIAHHNIDLVVGTHVLIQDEVRFSHLALAIIDEQHRFGVHQRLSLAARNPETDLLVMTATPIPRTLLLANFGDMEISRLDEKPPGRQPIATRAIPVERLGDVVERIRAAISQGAKVYWVCPLVEDSEQIDLAAAEGRAQDLIADLGPVVGLVHGRMKAQDKDLVMQRFLSGEVRVLVATTVIEVGVDVKDASIMVIEHAERFGLAQLHQLRGRVGRGTTASTCILLYKGPLGQTARARLDILRQTEDGFVLAEEDLRLRGGGEILGVRQSGLGSFRFALPDHLTDLMAMARDDARLLLAKDPLLTSPRGTALRLLLHLFGRDEAARLIHAG